MPLVGIVNSRRDAIVPLVISGPAGEARVDAVVDTGFSGFLLPPQCPRRATCATTVGHHEHNIG